MTNAKSIIEEFDPARVKPLEGQPRKRFRGIKELAGSIAEVGQICPGLVVRLAGDDKYDAQLIDGERRLRACTIAGKPFRAEVREALAGESIEELFATSFGANFGKQHHDAIEIAEALARMQRAGKSQQQMARIAGKSDTWVTMHLNLLKLHPQVQQMMIPAERLPGKVRRDRGTAGKLSLPVAQLLVQVDEARQLSLARKVTVAGGMPLTAARRMILRERHKSGEEGVYVNAHRDKAKSIASIEKMLIELTDRLGVWLDMPGVEFAHVFALCDNRTKRELIKSLDEAAESLTDLSTAIEGTLPKLTKAAS